jgi:hypothetical protein
MDTMEIMKLIDSGAKFPLIKRRIEESIDRFDVHDHENLMYRVMWHNVMDDPKEEVEICEMLLMKGMRLSRDLLPKVITRNRVLLVKFLVKYCNADVNAPDKNGKLPLTHAIDVGSHGSPAIVEYLVEGCKVDVDRIDEGIFGINALMYSILDGRFDLIKYLVDVGGANVNARTAHGTSVLMYSIRTGDCDIRDFLVSRGATFSGVDDVFNKVIWNYSPSEEQACLAMCKDLYTRVPGINTDILWNALDKACDFEFFDVFKYLWSISTNRFVVNPFLHPEFQRYNARHGSREAMIVIASILKIKRIGSRSKIRLPTDLQRKLFDFLD